jgi:hypothetical protein
MGGKYCFAAAGGNFKAYAGSIGYSVPCGIITFEAGKTGGYFRLRANALKSLDRAAYTAALEKHF